MRFAPWKRARRGLRAVAHSSEDAEEKTGPESPRNAKPDSSNAVLSGFGVEFFGVKSWGAFLG